MTTATHRRRLSKRLTLWSVGLVLWVGILFGIAIPSWRQAVIQHRHVEVLERQLADLDQWTVAGLWLEKSLGARRTVINPQWERLFPQESGKGELFWELARVADQSGVDEFELGELILDDEDDNRSVADDPSVPLETYRVRARFRGEYAQVAKFLGGLKNIERAVSVHNLAIRPVRGAVKVDLELDVYVSTSDQS